MAQGGDAWYIGGAIVLSDAAVLRGASPVITVAASDAPSRVRKRADYECDGAADEVEIQAALDALPDSGGIVHLLSGNYYIQKASVELDEGQYIIGEGMGGTIIQAHASHELSEGDSFLKLAEVNNFTNGGIRDLQLMGDGGIDGSSGTDQPDGTATLDGLNINLGGTTVSRRPLIQWEMERVYINRCRRGVNGDVDRQRDVWVTDCLFYYNDVGFHAYEHPTFVGGSFRWNAVGIGGFLYDAKINNVKMTYNEYGIKPDDTDTGIQSTFIVNTSIFASAKVGVYLGSGSILGSGCHIGTGSLVCEEGVRICGECVTIDGPRISAQSVTTGGWTTGAVVFRGASSRHYGTRITNCFFNNHIGPCIKSTGDLRSVQINGNYFDVNSANGGTLLSLTGTYTYGITFNANMGNFSASLDFGGASLIHINNNASASGNEIQSNLFLFSTAPSGLSTGYLFELGATNAESGSQHCSIINNRFERFGVFEIFKTTPADFYLCENNFGYTLPG
jgi:hypothetical protein